MDHANGHKTRYLHLSDRTVTWDQIVARGQLIGHEGNSGAIVYHLHFETRHDATAGDCCSGTAVDPYGSSTYMWTRNPPEYAGWHGWFDWGEAANPAPQAISYAADRPDHTHMVHRDAAGDIWIKWYDGSNWQGYQNISNGPSDPTFNGNVAISNHYGRIYVIATASNMVRLKYWDGTSWIGWQNISDGKAITGPIAISYGPGGRIDVVGVASNKAWHKWLDGSGWHPWWDMSGTTQITGSVAVANRNGLIHVVGWNGGVAKLKWWNGSGWYGWQSLVSPVDNGSLAIDNSNAVVGNTSSTHLGVHLLARASATAWLRCWDLGCNLSGWEPLNGYIEGPLAVTNQNAEIRVVAQASLHLWHKYRAK